MKLALVVLVLALLASSARADVLDVGVVLAGAADEYSTYKGLQLPGLYEAGLLRNTGVRVGVKAIVAASVIGAAHELDQHGHKGWSKVVRFTAVGIWGGAFGINMLKIRGR